MSSSQPAPQFDKADLGHEPQQGDVCHRCHQSIVGTYYRTNGAMTCASCANILQQDILNRPTGRFGRALLFGAAGAVLGIILYSAVGIITGLEIGYVSLAVGFIVAKAVLKGSGGIGGRKYQIAAVLLTYFAVSLSAVPISINLMREKQNGPAGAAKPAATKDAASAPSDNAAELQDNQEASGKPTGAKSEAKPTMGFFTAIAVLVGIGLVSPFLGLAEPVSGAIGLVILFVGMNIAWRMTAATERVVDGPYSV
jgi:hypothetical protein